MFDREPIDCLDERLEVARRLLRTDEPADFLRKAVALDNFNIHLLYGYVRSFVRLAYIGDIATAVADLGATRQTVKRHILELENLLECELFERVGSPSKLSERGVLWLPRAQEFIDMASVFLNRRGINKADYQSTQLPLRMLLSNQDNSGALRDFAEAWMLGVKTTACPKLAGSMDKSIIYERRNGIWASKTIGPNSAFSKWFGPEITRRSEGKTVPQMATGSELRDEVSFLLDGVYTRGGLHFSEVACKLHRPGEQGRISILFQRLLAELLDEDGRPVVASMIEILNHHQIDQAL